MQADFTTVCRLSVTHEELRLIGLALCGKLKGKDKFAAAELNTRLLEARIKTHETAAEVARGSLERAKLEMSELAAAGDASAGEAEQS